MLITEDSSPWSYVSESSKVTLPLSPQNGDKYVIKQEVSGTIIDGNGKNIDGLVTYTLPIPYQSATLVYMTNDWYVI